MARSTKLASLTTLTLPKLNKMIRYIILVGVLMVEVASATRPNIVYIMTDDQDVELGGMTPMPHAQKLLGEAGAVGGHFYIQGWPKRRVTGCVIPSQKSCLQERVRAT